MVDKLPEPLGIATVDGEPGAETGQRPGPLALNLGLQGLPRPAERGERDREPEHAVREQEPRRLQRQERAVRPPTHGRLVERRGAQHDHARRADPLRHRLGLDQARLAAAAIRREARSISLASSCEPDALDPDRPYAISVVQRSPSRQSASSPRARRAASKAAGDTPSSTRHQLPRRTSGASSATRWTTAKRAPNSRSRTTARWLPSRMSPEWPSTTSGQDRTRAARRRSATRDSPSGDVASCRSRSASRATARLARTSSADSIGLVTTSSCGRRGSAGRLSGRAGPARLLAGVALREIADELVPHLSRVRFLLLGAIGEAEPQERLGRVLAFGREVDGLLVLHRGPLEVARRVVGLADPELGGRRERIRRERQPVIELEDRLPCSPLFQLSIARSRSASGDRPGRRRRCPRLRSARRCGRRPRGPSARGSGARPWPRAAPDRCRAQRRRAEDSSLSRPERPRRTGDAPGSGLVSGAGREGGAGAAPGRAARDGPSIAGGVRPEPAADGAAAPSPAEAAGRTPRRAAALTAGLRRRRAPRRPVPRPGEQARHLTLYPPEAQLDAAERLAELGDSTLQEVDAPGLGVEHLDLALEVVAGRGFHRLPHGVELRPSLLRRAVRVLRARALGGLQLCAELAMSARRRSISSAQRGGRVGRRRRLRLFLGLRADPARRAAATEDGGQHRRERQRRGPSWPHATAWERTAAHPARSHAHSPNRAPAPLRGDQPTRREASKRAPTGPTVAPRRGPAVS